MKKIMMTMIAAVLALTLVFALAACGSEKTDTKAKTDTTENGGALSASDVIFSYNGVSVELNSSIDDMLAALGEANEVKSQLSCHGIGDDKTFTYDGFVVNSYPNDGKDYVLEVVIKSESIPTSKGITIGSSAADVIAAYGDGYKAVGHYYAYDAGSGKSLQFLVENDAVVEISYYYDV